MLFRLLLPSHREYLTISLYIHKIAIIGIMFDKLYYTIEITCMISHAKYAL